eukprot:SAG11_NODE_15998_length_560_cov_0.422993_2_plen_79_part_01
MSWTAPTLASWGCVPSSQISLMSLGANEFWHGALLMAAPWGPALGARANMTVSVNPGAGGPNAGWAPMLPLDDNPLSYG